MQNRFDQVKNYEFDLKITQNFLTEKNFLEFFCFLVFLIPFAIV